MELLTPMPGREGAPTPVGDDFEMVKSWLVFVVLTVALLAELALGYGVKESRDERPAIGGAPSVGVWSERMRRARADNSLVFMQDWVGYWVKAVGRVHQVLPDGVVVFRETGDEAPDLWCAPAGSIKVPRFRRGHWAILHGQVVDFVPGHASTRGRLLLRECEFLRVIFGSF